MIRKMLNPIDNSVPSLANSPADSSEASQIAFQDGGQEVQEWGIRDLARKFDITPRTIRFYEDKGLLTPRREGNARIFSAREYDRLTQILRAKRMGFSLDDIKEVFDVMDGEVLDRSELLRRKNNFQRVIESLGRRQSDSETMQHNLTALCMRIQAYLDDPSKNVNILQFSSAYEAAFRGAIPDDFADEAC